MQDSSAVVDKQVGRMQTKVWLYMFSFLLLLRVCVAGAKADGGPALWRASIILKAHSWPTKLRSALSSDIQLHTHTHTHNYTC